ncbi:hypothetical protein ASH01_16240 [Terrabacter sp. Soil811]|uniref:hypothetical protein n=1 Tax=Terrabacter sp. Soil811 TaxID=1736419 RepID=UPI000712B5B2|nr:hypothetical protein [Terrabacter sp. Soil811]KRF42389.1 hypothetical protein ASH01_16240 [Terrabacter sp. Soil811]
MTTSMTPTHGDPLRHGTRPLSDGDHERWLPDPSWPVPPRGWQLWAAAGSTARPGRAGTVDSGPIDDESNSHTRLRIDDTVDVKSEMPYLAVLEDASFTLPTRPSALVDHERVDLLADRPARRVPEGAVAGFAVLGALVLFSCLVGGLTGGLIVIGVSTLLAASAALVRGHLSLSRVGGQRGAGLLLGAAVTALILGSVATHDRRPGVEVLPSAPVPVSSDRVTDTHAADAAVPRTPSATSVASTAPTPRAIRSTEPAAAAAGPTPVLPTVPSEPAESAESDEPVVPVSDVTPAATPRADASALASGSSTGGEALTLKPDALSPSAVTPADGKSVKSDKAPKSPKDPKTSKASKDTTAKDAKNTGSKNTGSKNTGSKNTGSKNTGSKNNGGKDNGAKNTNGKASDGTANANPQPKLSDAGIGGSGAATTSVTGFSTTPGTRAHTATLRGVAALPVR